VEVEMAHWGLHPAEAHRILDETERTATAYVAHARRLDAALNDVLAALPGSPLVAARVAELAEALIRPRFQDLVTESARVVAATRSAVTALQDGDAAMTQHGADAAHQLDIRTMVWPPMAG
jgi:hypothetical protein